MPTDNISDHNLDCVTLATELTVAWLSNANNRVDANDVLAFLHKMHQTVIGLTGAGVADDTTADETHKPAVSVRKSLASPDHIISMIDGKPYRTLRRHLSTHGLTPEQYRER
ncbi:MAG: MucR family transcriptional regulator, partial [Pseudomonadota bacterium]|nr:MucR family transcriptional regulator [Pseudomonadota bacterium]